MSYEGNYGYSQILSLISQLGRSLDNLMSEISHLERRISTIEKNTAKLHESFVGLSERFSRLLEIVALVENTTKRLEQENRENRKLLGDVSNVQKRTWDEISKLVEVVPEHLESFKDDVVGRIGEQGRILAEQLERDKEEIKKFTLPHLLELKKNLSEITKEISNNKNLLENLKDTVNTRIEEEKQVMKSLHEDEVKALNDAKNSIIEELEGNRAAVDLVLVGNENLRDISLDMLAKFSNFSKLSEKYFSDISVMLADMEMVKMIRGK